MQVLESKREERLSYRAAQQFVAYLSEGLIPVYIREGATIIADPDHWTGWIWNGRESVRFFLERNQFYVDRKTFLDSTEALD